MIRRNSILRAAAGVLLLLTAAGGALVAQIPADREALLNGDENGMTAYARSNGYPRPKDVLDLADKLDLNARQKQGIRELDKDTRTRARVLGKLIVQVEEELHFAFNSGMVGEESVEDDAESIGKMRGTLRGIHLAACLKAMGFLNQKQKEKYRALWKAEESKKPEEPGKK